jgi:hypothetical protein
MVAETLEQRIARLEKDSPRKALDPEKHVTIRITHPSGLLIGWQHIPAGGRITIQKKSAEPYLDKVKPLAVAERVTDMDLIQGEAPKRPMAPTPDEMPAIFARRRAGQAAEARAKAKIAVDFANTFGDVPVEPGQFDPSTVVGLKLAPAKKTG